MNTIEPSLLAAVVVWFHPTRQHVENVLRYASVIGRVYIVDNSEEDAAALSAHIANAMYLPNHANKGIAYALNRGYEQAIAEGYEWIISFDQDSSLQAEQLQQYVQLCNACPLPNVGIYAPYPSYGNELPNSTTYEQRDTVITSGSLMSAKTFQQVGPFREEYFIDLVDDEYCLRVKRAGMAIILVNAIIMPHSLGNGYITVPLLHHRFVEHNALRHYYIVRNTLMIMREYEEHRLYYRRQLLKRIKRLCLYDGHDKWAKIRMCIQAYRDYRAGRMGIFVPVAQR